MIEADPKKSGERPAGVFYGWWIVAFSMVAEAVKHGTFMRGFTVFVLPIEKQLGITRTAVSLADSVGRLEGGLQGPVMGYLTDRLGPQPMIAAGGLLTGLGFILLSFTHSYWYFMLVFVALLAVGFRTGYDNATVPAVNQWFLRKKSLAMSLTSTGRALGGVAIIPLMAAVVEGLGWRIAALMCGVGIIVVVMPLALLIRRSPESMGLLPDGDARRPEPRARAVGLRQDTPPNPGAGRRFAAGALAAPARGSIDFTAREAMKTPSYWLYVAGVGLRNAVFAGTSFHMVPLMVWAGTSEPKAALLVGLLAFGTLLFNPIVGWMGDIWSKQKISAAAMVVGALAMLMLLPGNRHLWQLALVVLLLAFSESVNPLAWAILGDFFGRRSFATLRGWSHLPDQLMSMTTPVWMGIIFDRTDSYVWALVPLACMSGLSSVFYWTLPLPKPPARLRTRSLAHDV